VGHTGSVHDSWSFRSTRIFKDHEHVLAPDEWIWADSAYPSETWCVSPYKKPIGGELTPDQRTYNYHVSRVCMTSFLVYSTHTNTLRFEFVLNMPSASSKAASKRYANCAFKFPRRSTTNGQSFLFVPASYSTTSYSDSREGTLTRDSANTCTKLEDGMCHLITISRRTRAGTSCIMHVDGLRPKANIFVVISWFNYSTAHLAGQSDGRGE
jgi:hypothetical protein